MIAAWLIEFAWGKRERHASRDSQTNRHKEGLPALLLYDCKGRGVFEEIHTFIRVAYRLVKFGVLFKR